MGRGGQLAGAVAQAEFDAAEQLRLGGIDEVLGHAAQGLLGGGPQLVDDGADAVFTVLGGRRRG
jgi:hypothetical protein